MPKKFTDEEYAKMLPKKQVGTAVLFFNAEEEILILNLTTRKDGLFLVGQLTMTSHPYAVLFEKQKKRLDLIFLSYN